MTDPLARVHPLLGSASGPLAMQSAHANGLSNGHKQPLERISMQAAFDKRPQQVPRHGKPLLTVGKHAAAAASSASAAAASAAAPAAPPVAPLHGPHGPVAAASTKPPLPKLALITAPTPAAAAAAAASAATPPQSNGHAASAMPQAKATRQRTPPRQRDASNHVIGQQPQPASPARKPRVLAAATIAQQLSRSPVGSGLALPSSAPPNPLHSIDLTEDEEMLIPPLVAVLAAAAAPAPAPAPAAAAAVAAGQEGANGLAQSKRKRDASQPRQEERKEATAARHIPAFLTKKPRITAAPPASATMTTAVAASSAAVPAVAAAASAISSHTTGNRAARSPLDEASWAAGWNSAVSFRPSAASSAAPAAAAAANTQPHIRDSAAAVQHAGHDSDEMLALLIIGGQLLPQSAAPAVAVAAAPSVSASADFPELLIDLSHLDDAHSSEVGDEDESAGDTHEQHAAPARSAAAAAAQANKMEWTSNAQAAVPAAASAAVSSSSAAAAAASPPFPFTQRSGTLWQPHRRRAPAFAKKTEHPVDIDLTWSDSEDAVPGDDPARYKRGKRRLSDADEADDEVMEIADRSPAKAAAARAGGPIVSPHRIDSIDSLADHQSPDHTAMDDGPVVAAASSSRALPATVAAGARASDSDEIDSLADHVSPADGQLRHSQPVHGASRWRSLTCLSPVCDCRCQIALQTSSCSCCRFCVSLSCQAFSHFG